MFFIVHSPKKWKRSLASEGTILMDSHYVAIFRQWQAKIILLRLQLIGV
jgi:hypothetical protein